MLSGDDDVSLDGIHGGIASDIVARSTVAALVELDLNGWLAIAVQASA